jgi:hypothetical protein
VQFFPSSLLRSELTKIVRVSLHLLNVWHLPLQELVLAQLAHLVATFPREMRSSLPSLLPEVVRLQIFYGKRSLPDVSLAGEEDARRLVSRVRGLLELLREKFSLDIERWKKSMSLDAADWGENGEDEQFLRALLVGL